MHTSTCKNVTFASVSIRVTDDQGVDTTVDTGNVALVNNMMHSLFREVRIQLGHNQVEITPSMGTYPYRAYMENLLSFGTSAKGTYLKCVGWHTDQAGKMDHHFGEGEGGTNTGLTSRRNVIVPTKEVELMGRLHCDLFLQDRYLIDGVPMKLDLIRSAKEFHMMCPADKKYNLTITKAEFYTRQVNINPRIREQHISTMMTGGGTGTSAKYPLTRVQVTAHDIPQGGRDFHKDQLIGGQLPKRIVLGLVSNAAFVGSTTKNPFNFHHYNVSNLKLKLNGQEIHGTEIRSDFAAQSTQIRQLYMDLFRNTGQLHRDNPVYMSLNDYTRGFTLWVVDLTPDLSADEGGTHHPRQTGKLGLELQFAESVPHPVTLVCYEEYENVLEIDRFRNALMV